MRVLAFTFVVLGLSTAAMSAPVHRLNGFGAQLVRQDEPRLRMPSEAAYAPRRGGSPEENGLILSLQNGQQDMRGTSGISFGPIHAESEVVNGRRHVRYRLDGPTLLGGDIGGSVSRHGAMLTLHWTPSGN